MLRRFLVSSVGAVGLLFVLLAPGQLQAQHRGGSPGGMHSSFGGGLRPGFTGGFRTSFPGRFDMRFNRGFDRSFDRFEDRFENRFGSGRFDRFEDRFERRFNGFIDPRFSFNRFGFVDPRFGFMDPRFSGSVFSPFGVFPFSQGFFVPF